MQWPIGADPVNLACRVDEQLRAARFPGIREGVVSEVQIYLIVLIVVIAAGAATVWLLVTGLQLAESERPAPAGDAVRAGATNADRIAQCRSRLRNLPVGADPLMRAALEATLAELYAGERNPDGARCYAGLDAAESAANCFAGHDRSWNAAAMHSLAARFSARLARLESEPAHLARASRALAAARVLRTRESAPELWEEDEAVARLIEGAAAGLDGRHGWDPARLPSRAAE